MPARAFSQPCIWRKTMETPDVTTETKVSTSRTSGITVNSNEGQQWMYLALLIMALVLSYPDIKEQCNLLFGAAMGALFAKSKNV